MNNPTYSAAELAERFAVELRGDGATRIRGVATLSCANAEQLAFLANSRYRSQLADSQAGIVVVAPADAEATNTTRLVTPQPYVAFAKIAALFDTPDSCDPGIHPSATVDSRAEIAPSACIGPFAYIGARSRIGPGANVGPGCIIGDDCTLGDNSELIARVTLVTRVHLGKRVRIHPGAVIGADGFGLAMDAGHWIKVPQLGGVVIGDDCEIGANTCIDRGALEDTVLEEDVRLDNLVQIGHNVRIGAHSAIAGCTGIAGSTRIGRYCLIAGHVGIAGHLEIGDRVTILGKSMVSHSIREAGEYSSGLPATDSRAWRKIVARLKQLDTLARRIRGKAQESE